VWAKDDRTLQYKSSSQRLEDIEIRDSFASVDAIDGGWNLLGPSQNCHSLDLGARCLFYVPVASVADWLPAHTVPLFILPPSMSISHIFHSLAFSNPLHSPSYQSYKTAQL